MCCTTHVSNLSHLLSPSFFLCLSLCSFFSHKKKAFQALSIKRTARKRKEQKTHVQQKLWMAFSQPLEEKIMLQQMCFKFFTRFYTTHHIQMGSNFRRNLFNFENFTSVADFSSHHKRKRHILLPTIFNLEKRPHLCITMENWFVRTHIHTTTRWKMKNDIIRSDFNLKCCAMEMKLQNG